MTSIRALRRPRLPATGQVTAGLLCASAVLCAQSIYEQVFSFGVSAESAAVPAAAPCEGADGRLYGTSTSGGASNLGTVFRVEKDGSGFKNLHSFAGPDGGAPYASVIQASNGRLFGVAAERGAGGRGTVFTLQPDGTEFATLWAFAADGTEGGTPTSQLVLADDGLLHGCAYSGGFYGAGTLFSLHPDGRGFVVMRQFGATPSDGRQPAGDLVQAADGWLYGTTERGGPTDAGIAFRISKTGTDYQVLKEFVPTSEGAGAYSGLIQGRDGRLYGTLFTGGLRGGGCAYSLATDGSGFRVLASFSASTAAGLAAPLTEGSDGWLYGMASAGGTDGSGAIIRCKTDGSGLAVLKAFSQRTDDLRNGVSRVVEAADGQLYFATPFGGSRTRGGWGRLARDGSAFTVLWNASDSGSEATHPRARVAAGSDGFLYGTAEMGGPAASGAIFRIRPDGSAYGVVHAFAGMPADGEAPASEVIEGSDGTLYGTARTGGLADRGVVYRVAKDGTGYGVVHHFAGPPADGDAPFAAVTEAEGGWLFGVTSVGGASNRGTVFRFQVGGVGYQVIRSFAGGANDGATPAGSLVRASDGQLYGVTYEGGGANAGTVFRIRPDGSGYGVVRVFSAAAGTSKNPWAGLIEGSNGRLYGTSQFGGDGGGTVYSLAKDGGDLKVLATFSDTGSGGRYPIGGLIEDSRGRLWGTTWAGGALGNGVVFALNLDGSGYEVAHSFQSSATGGSGPVGSLLAWADGVLYGTTTTGGVGNDGTVFRLSSTRVVQIVSLARVGGGVADLRVQAVPGWQCSLEAAPEVARAAWTEVASGRVPADGQLELRDSTAGLQTRRFYRVQATPGK